MKFLRHHDFGVAHIDFRTTTVAATGSRGSQARLPPTGHVMRVYFSFTSQNRSTQTDFMLSGFLGGAAHRYTSPWSFVLPSL